MFEKFKRKLKGREIEFGAFVTEAILMDPRAEEIEFDVAKERLDKYSKEQLIKKIEDLSEILTHAYMSIHSWNQHCNAGHDDWKDFSIKQYKALIKNNTISDRFGIETNGLINININDYENIIVHEPKEKIDLEYSLYSNNESYSTNPDNHIDLQLIKSYNDPNKYYVSYNEKGKIGNLTIIEESKLLALTAKNRLLREKKDEV